ncbi:transcription antitermination factor NusB [Ornithinicoccus hortensis]|uniref:Transcription antitermination protein NusB n=1 Tax=Ornithinicoccus hortensis TaxID=82346 RepID=A0A542YSH9_9MICO|nr:transcription antitermination factor NusB [Ornithinicoccus hortensis]TQL51028.1 NusB antitermination factor [Ornithinicoccus hortensis]
MGARTKARKRALELLFEAELREVNVADLLAERLAAPTTQHPLPDYTAELVRGVVGRWTAINEVLSTYSQGWPLERMPAVDRAVLRIAAWEIVWNDEVPDGVAIAEAVELTQRLSTDDSPKFVNGLLARVSEVKLTLA